MCETALYLCKNLQGVMLAYTQSDEISLLLQDYKSIETNALFNYNVQKLTSITASLATSVFNRIFWEKTKDLNNSVYDKVVFTANFDSRACNYPKEEVCNYFIWRQQDATRNAIQGLGQKYFSHSQLMSKNCKMIQEMLFQDKGINFNDCPISFKRGVCINQKIDRHTGQLDWIVNKEIPIFTQDRNYIDSKVFI